MDILLEIIKKFNSISATYHNNYFAMTVVSGVTTLAVMIAGYYVKKWVEKFTTKQEAKNSIKKAFTVNQENLKTNLSEHYLPASLGELITNSATSVPNALRSGQLILILGDAGAGKSELSSRIASGYFKDDCNANIKTAARLPPEDTSIFLFKASDYNSDKKLAGSYGFVGFTDEFLKACKTNNYEIKTIILDGMDEFSDKRVLDSFFEEIDYTFKSHSAFRNTRLIITSRCELLFGGDDDADDEGSAQNYLIKSILKSRLNQEWKVYSITPFSTSDQIKYIELRLTNGTLNDNQLIQVENLRKSDPNAILFTNNFYLMILSKYLNNKVNNDKKLFRYNLLNSYVKELIERKLDVIKDKNTEHFLYSIAFDTITSKDFSSSSRKCILAIDDKININRVRRYYGSLVNITDKESGRYEVNFLNEQIFYFCVSEHLIESGALSKKYALELMNTLSVPTARNIFGFYLEEHLIKEALASENESEFSIQGNSQREMLKAIELFDPALYSCLGFHESSHSQSLSPQKQDPWVRGILELINSTDQLKNIGDIRAFVKDFKRDGITKKINGILLPARSNYLKHFFRSNIVWYLIKMSDEVHQQNHAKTLEYLICDEPHEPWVKYFNDCSIWKDLSKDYNLSFYDRNEIYPNLSSVESYLDLCGKHGFPWVAALMYHMINDNKHNYEFSDEIKTKFTANLIAYLEVKIDYEAFGQAYITNLMLGRILSTSVGQKNLTRGLIKMQDSQYFRRRFLKAISSRFVLVSWLSKQPYSFKRQEIRQEIRDSYERYGVDIKALFCAATAGEMIDSYIYYDSEIIKIYGASWPLTIANWIDSATPKEATLLVKAKLAVKDDFLTKISFWKKQATHQEAIKLVWGRLIDTDGFSEEMVLKWINHPHRLGELIRKNVISPNALLNFYFTGPCEQNIFYILRDSISKSMASSEVNIKTLHNILFEAPVAEDYLSLITEKLSCDSNFMDNLKRLCNAKNIDREPFSFLLAIIIAKKFHGIQLDIHTISSEINESIIKLDLGTPWSFEILQSLINEHSFDINENENTSAFYENLLSKYTNRKFDAVSIEG